MRRIVLVIAGTPGTGKTTIAKILVKKLGAIHVELSSLALRSRCVREYDDKRDTYIIDDKKLSKRVLKIISTQSSAIYVIDTHYPEILPPNIVDKVIVLRLNPIILYNRLKNKKWRREKIVENVEAEIIGIVSLSAREHFGPDKVKDLDVSSLSPKEAAKTIMQYVLANKEHPNLKDKPIDWSTHPEVLLLLRNLHNNRLS